MNFVQMCPHCYLLYAIYIYITPPPSISAYFAWSKGRSRVMTWWERVIYALIYACIYACCFKYHWNNIILITIMATLKCVFKSVWILMVKTRNKNESCSLPKRYVKVYYLRCFIKIMVKKRWKITVHKPPTVSQCLLDTGGNFCELFYI